MLNYATQVKDVLLCLFNTLPSVQIHEECCGKLKHLDNILSYVGYFCGK